MVEKPKHCPLPTNRQGEIPQQLRSAQPGEKVEVLPSKGGRISAEVKSHIETDQEGNGRTRLKIDGEVKDFSWRTACIRD